MPESAKEGDSVLPEGSDIGLGPSGRRFEPCHSDQQGLTILSAPAFCLFCYITDSILCFIAKT